MSGVIDAASFRSGMRQLAAAVSVIATEHEGQRAGMTATSVSSLTADPPQLGVAINRNNASYAAVVGSRRFAVNVLSHEQAEIAASFAGMLGLQGDARFGAEAASWSVLETGAPVLDHTAATFDCELVQEVELSSHVLMVGLVRAVRVTPTTTPLLFMDGTWASLVRADTAALDSYEAIISRVDAAMGAARHGDDPGQQFASFIRNFAEIYATEVPALRQFFSQHAIAPVSRLDALAARKRDIEGTLLDLLRRGRAAGQFDLPDPAIATQAIFGMFGSIHRWPAESGWEPETVAGTLQSLAASLAGAMPASAPARR